MTTKAKIVIRAYQDIKLDIPDDIAGDIEKSREYAIAEIKKRVITTFQYKVVEHWACKTKTETSNVVQVRLAEPAEMVDVTPVVVDVTHVVVDGTPVVVDGTPVIVTPVVVDVTPLVGTEAQKLEA